MACHLREHIQRQIYFFGAYEPIEAALFSRLIRPGMCVVDAGANVGQYTLLAAKAVGPKGMVHAFEPIPKNYRALVEHVQRNGFTMNVRTNACALWETETTLTLHLDDADAQDNATNFSVSDHGGTVESIPCRALRLDTYAVEQKLGRVDLIKMDIEGAEMFALRGARRVLEESRPTLLVEINRAHAQALDYDPEAVWNLLRPLGYQLFVIGHSAATSKRLETLDGIDRANVIFSARELPPGLLDGWTFKSILNELRSNAFAATGGA